MVKVYIGDLGNNASKTELKDKFEKYGSVKDVWIAKNPPGFAFVTFDDDRDAEDAVRELNGTELCGSKARVEMSHSRYRSDRRRSPEGRRSRNRSYSRSPPRRRKRSPSSDRSRSRSPVYRRRSPPKRRSYSRSSSRD